MAGIFRLYDLPMQDNENIDFVKVGTDSLTNGQLVVAKDVVGTYLDGQGALYTPVKPATVADAFLAIVASEGYYHDGDGNRISIDDPTVKVFTTGDRIRVIRPAMNKKYFLSNDLITGTPIVGGYLIPTASAYGWTFAADVTAVGTAKVALYIEQINVNDTFVGLNAVTGVRVRVARVTTV